MLALSGVLADITATSACKASQLTMNLHLGIPSATKRPCPAKLPPHPSLLLPCVVSDLQSTADLL